MAKITETGEVPPVREVLALLGFYWLNAAIASVQESAFTVGFFLQGQALSIVPQARVLLDEVMLCHAQKIGYGGNFHFLQPNLSRPPTAGGATLAFVVSRHLDRCGQGTAELLREHLQQILRACKFSSFRFRK